MIILRNIDGTVEAEGIQHAGAGQVVRVDEEMNPRPDFEAARSGKGPPLYRRLYNRARRLWPNRYARDVRPEHVVFMYEETTNPREMATDQVLLRLPQIEAEIARLDTVAGPLREVAARSGALRAEHLAGKLGALTVARDAWLSGRLADARAILRQAMTDEQALATVQQWTAEEWRRTAESGAA